MRDLWPSMQIIHARFNADIGASTAPVLWVADAAPTEMTEIIAVPEPPAVLKQLFARRAAAENYLFAPSPSVGQVVLLDDRIGSGRQFVLALLLDEQTGPDKWSGWIVTPDTDYAAYWDVLLDHRDDPFDPEAGMIQVWNPITVQVAVGAKVLAQLTPERLAAVRLMASEYVSPKRYVDERANPGHVAPRSLANGDVVVTGTPLGDSTDLRRVYQSYYADTASRLRASTQSSNIATFPTRGKYQLKSGEEDLAAAALVQRDPWKEGEPLQKEIRFSPALLVSVIINAVLLIAIVVLLRAPQQVEEQEPTTTPVAAHLQVKFKATAQEHEIRNLLQDVHGRVIDGPAAGGMYVIEVSPAMQGTALSILRRSKVVESATN
jgi:hypothetical protein